MVWQHVIKRISHGLWLNTILSQSFCVSIPWTRLGDRQHTTRRHSAMLRREMKNFSIYHLHYIRYCNYSHNNKKVIKHETNVIQLPTIQTPEPCLLLFTSHVTAVNHVTVIKMKLLDRSLKIPLVQRHPVVFGQTICYKRKSITYVTSKVLGVLYAVCEGLLILIKKNYCKPRLYIEITYKNIKKIRIFQNLQDVNYLYS